MSDLIPGTSFVNGQTVTANDLNELIGSASIDNDVISSVHLKDDLVTSLDQLLGADFNDEDLFLVWSPSQSKFLKIRKADFLSDSDNAKTLGNDFIGILSSGQIHQKRDVINLFGTETGTSGTTNATNAIFIRSANKIMLIGPVVGSGMTLEVQGDVKANNFLYADGTQVSSGGGSSTSAFSFAGSTLTMTSTGTGTATFTVSGTTLTITT